MKISFNDKKYSIGDNGEIYELCNNVGSVVKIVEKVKNYSYDGHKEINRTNLSMEQMEEALQKEVVLKQLDMLRFRSKFPAFSFDSDIIISHEDGCMSFLWEKDGYTAQLKADLNNMKYEIIGKDPSGKVEYDGPASD